MPPNSWFNSTWPILRLLVMSYIISFILKIVFISGPVLFALNNNICSLLIWCLLTFRHFSHTFIFNAFCSPGIRIRSPIPNYCSPAGIRSPIPNYCLCWLFTFSKQFRHFFGSSSKMPWSMYFLFSFLFKWVHNASDIQLFNLEFLTDYTIRRHFGFLFFSSFSLLSSPSSRSSYRFCYFPVCLDEVYMAWILFPLVLLLVSWIF